MPKVIRIQGIGKVRFPDTMDDAAIAAAVEKDILHTDRGGAPPRADDPRSRVAARKSGAAPSNMATLTADNREPLVKRVLRNDPSPVGTAARMFMPRPPGQDPTTAELLDEAVKRAPRGVGIPTSVEELKQMALPGSGEELRTALGPKPAVRGVLAEGVKRLPIPAVQLALAQRRQVQSFRETDSIMAPRPLRAARAVGALVPVLGPMVEPALERLAQPGLDTAAGRQLTPETQMEAAGAGGELGAMAVLPKAAPTLARGTAAAARAVKGKLTAAPEGYVGRAVSRPGGKAIVEDIQLPGETFEAAQRRLGKTMLDNFPDLPKRELAPSVVRTRADAKQAALLEDIAADPVKQVQFTPPEWTREAILGPALENAAAIKPGTLSLPENVKTILREKKAGKPLADGEYQQLREAAKDLPPEMQEAFARLDDVQARLSTVPDAPVLRTDALVKLHEELARDAKPGSLQLRQAERVRRLLDDDVAKRVTEVQTLRKAADSLEVHAQQMALAPSVSESPMLGTGNVATGVAMGTVTRAARKTITSPRFGLRAGQVVKKLTPRGPEAAAVAPPAAPAAPERYKGKFIPRGPKMRPADTVIDWEATDGTVQKGTVTGGFRAKDGRTAHVVQVLNSKGKPRMKDGKPVRTLVFEDTKTGWKSGK
mgnify:CR=1 FL=1